VWSASERTVAAADASSGAPLFTLPEADGFVKALLPSGWAVWACGAGGVRALAARAGWEAVATQVGGEGGCAVWHCPPMSPEAHLPCARSPAAG
jgi:hypothetical protein